MFGIAQKKNAYVLVRIFALAMCTFISSSDKGLLSPSSIKRITSEIEMEFESLQPPEQTKLIKHLNSTLHRLLSHKKLLENNSSGKEPVAMNTIRLTQKGKDDLLFIYASNENPHVATDRFCTNFDLCNGKNGKQLDILFFSLDKHAPS